ncbi:MAG TPA: type II toxin-antitoxin system prevent-host-death family antitoxin [Spirochaetales bacterium]|nr:type II toxin-antitoxin system prevent-host-death family antitoxin [Spirochaetales bacterium]HOV37927.1 type II toxin-antitoxin system prevent-host-death family antitoxin [Spirochaetales bacterium]
MVINISEAKAKLSKLVEMMYQGEKVVIAKNNLPLVDLVPHKPEGKRSLGSLKGSFTLPDTFNNEDEELNNLFYGKDE